MVKNLGAKRNLDPDDRARGAMVLSSASPNLTLQSLQQTRERCRMKVKMVPKWKQWEESAMHS